MTVEFLSDEVVLQHINQQLLNAEEAILAVAFWGEGAVEQLNLKRLESNKKITIICDLMSGACNPSEIREILGLVNNNSSVRYLNGLHAKIYWTPYSVIVGSSNMSSNGLCFEDEETAGSLEANLKTDDVGVLAQSNKWLQDIIKKSREVTESDIAVAEIAWKKARASRLVRQTSNQNFIEELRERPWTFYDRNIKIWIYSDFYLDPPAVKALEAAQKELRNSKIEAYQNVTRKNTPAGMYVIDYPYSVKKNGEIRHYNSSACRMLSDSHIRQYSAGKRHKAGNVALHYRVHEICGFSTSRNELKILQALINEYIYSDAKLSNKLAKNREIEISIESLCQFHHFGM